MNLCLVLAPQFTVSYQTEVGGVIRSLRVIAQDDFDAFSKAEIELEGWGNPFVTDWWISRVSYGRWA